MSYVYSPQPQPTGIATLGDVISRAGDQFFQMSRQDKLRAEQRQQQLDDETRQHSYALGLHQRDRGEQLADRTDTRAYDEKIHRERMMDETIKHLISMGYMSQDDLTKPNSQEIVANAVERSRKDGLNLTGMANMKAAIAQSFDLTPQEKAFAETADPRDPKAMEQLTGIYQKASAGADQRAKTAYDQEQSSRTNAGNMIGGLFQEKAGLNQLINEAYTPPSPSEIENELRLKYGDAYAVMKQKNDPALALDRDKIVEHLSGIKIMKAQNAERRLREIDNQITAVATAAQKHALGGTPTPPAVTPSPAAPPARGPANADSFMAGKTQPAPPALAPSPSVASAYDEGGVPAALGALGASVPDARTFAEAALPGGQIASWLYDNAQYIPGTLNQMAGGSKRLAEGDAERARHLANARRNLGLDGP